MKASLLLIVLAAVAVALAGVVLADDCPASQTGVWANCGKPTTDDIVIRDLQVSPVPAKKGQPFNVSILGSIQREITGGSLKLSVKYIGVPLYSHTFDLCKDFQKVFNCPVQPNPNFNHTITEPFPGLIPSGKYTGELQAVDSNGNEIFCVCFAIQATTTPAPAEEEIVDAEAAPVLDDAMIAEVNSRQLGWTAGRNARFEGVTLREAKKLLGTKFRANTNVPDLILHATSIPATFDARTQWPGLIHPIRDQQQCGSCWAFGATEALSDRFAIATKGAVNVVLSPQDLVSCDTTDYGCEGGYLDHAWTYLQSKGTVEESCFPYSSGSGEAPACTEEKAGCKRYKASDIVHPTTVETIQTLIMTSGPVEGGFSVYQDFFTYKSGVYVKHSNSLAGGHAIKILGWGSEEDPKTKKMLDYWLVANSWGESWGMQGFFKILRGKNECGIESQIYAGTPVVA